MVETGSRKRGNRDVGVEWEGEKIHLPSHNPKRFQLDPGGARAFDAKDETSIDNFFFIFRLEIVLVIHSGVHSIQVVCRELAHLENYTQPHAPGK